jgi:hypothetical protein
MRARETLGKEASLSWRRFAYGLMIGINLTLFVLSVAMHRPLLLTGMFGCAVVLWSAAWFQVPPRALVPRNMKFTRDGIAYDGADGRSTTIPWRKVLRVIDEGDALVFVIAGYAGARPRPSLILPKVAGEPAFDTLWHLLYRTLVATKNLHPSSPAALRVIANTAATR